MPGALSFVRLRCKEIVPTVDVQLVTALSSLFASLIGYAGLVPEQPSPSASAVRAGGGAGAADAKGGAGGAGLAGAAADTEDSSERISSRGITSLFIFCLVWTLGGSIDEASRAAFDEFVRKHVDPEGSVVPTHGTVHDLALAPPPKRLEVKAAPGAKKGSKSETPERWVAPCPSFVTWQSLVPTFTYNGALPFFRILVPTVDTVVAAFMLRANLGASRPTMLCGGSGVGKSVVVQSVLSQMAEGVIASPTAEIAPSWISAQLNFSAQTSAGATQMMIEMRLEKLRRTQLGPPPGKRLALFVDDVNMPALEQYGAAPPVELLRLLLDRGGLYDRTKPFWKDVTDVTLVCACGPPGGGRSALTPRFVRHHHVLCFPQPSAHSLRAILSAIVGGFLAQRPLEVREGVRTDCI